MDTMRGKFYFNPAHRRGVVNHVQGKVTLPAAQACELGVEDGQPVEVRREGDDLVVTRTDTSVRAAVWKLIQFERKPARFEVRFGASSLGLPEGSGTGDIELRLVDGALRFSIDGLEVRHVTKRAEELADLPDLREATRGLYDGAFALVQDGLRRPENGVSRPVGLDAAVDMLRESGYRVERTGTGCWRIDDKSASRADLSDLVRKVDADAFLVAA